jgi:hypothetical protein
MSKQLLSGDFMKKNDKVRTSKSDEVCRYLLFSIAQDIGPNTLDLVRFLCPNNISESDCLVLDEILVNNIFTDSQIEEAARLTKRLSHHLWWWYRDGFT